MAKKTAEKKPVTKKPRRRLKRTARRSLAAVLMITAVVVAAIPVPENVAAPEGGIAMLADEPEPDKYRYPTDEMAKKKLCADDKLSTDLTDDKLNRAYIVTELSDGTYQMAWQFKFFMEYVEDDQHGIISKYNSTYQQDEVTLNPNVIYKYDTIEPDVVTEYFTDNADVTYECIKPNPENTNDQFLSEYFPKSYEDYVKEYDEWKAKHDAWENTPVTTPAGPEPQQPDSLKKKVSELSDSDKLKYYCDENVSPNHNNNNSLKGCKLVEVIDSSQKDEGGANHRVYIPQKIEGKEISYTRFDKYGLRYISDASIIGIGDEAFKDTENVDKLLVPKEIKYVGQSAFEHSFIKEITFVNMGSIGDRAFKNCQQLTKIDFGTSPSMRKIGVESFYGTSLAEVVFPSTIEEIGPGSFAYCESIQKLDFSKITARPAVIDEYAFYNSRALNEVNFMQAGSATITVNIDTIGDGAFAVINGETGNLTDFIFPSKVSMAMGEGADIGSGTVGLGDCVLAGRTNLKKVIMPSDFGRDRTAKVPDNTFYNCYNLECVEFPDDGSGSCGLATYDPGIDDDGERTPGKGLFRMVSNPDFYVQGPELDRSRSQATPRKQTWDAATAVSYVVPYLYIKNKLEYWEISDGDYLMCVNDKGVLTSCERKDKTTVKKNIDLVIPAQVGNTEVTGIDSKCFSDKDLNNNVKTLKIADDGKIAVINDAAFRGWETLQKVYIGNSIGEIGDNAFEGCKKLVDVTFSSPKAGHEAFKIGTDAFKTGSDRLTFHGDIVNGYAPFEWAMDPNNIIDKDQENSEGIRVCYKSMAPTYITVMYNPITEMVTMLDYPKYDQIDSILAAAHESDLKAFGVSNYNEYRQEYLYSLYRDSKFDDRRTAFANAWNAADSEEAREAAYASDNYGPWINPEYAAGGWKKDVTGTPVDPDEGEDGASTKIVDWLFEPLTVYAAEGDPDPYYTRNKYNVLLNASAKDPYRPSTPEEDYLLNAVENIVVPEGVQSIDVYGYVNNLMSNGKEYEGKDKSNTGNASRYFTSAAATDGWDTNTKRMYTAGAISSSEDDSDTKVRSMPGLFSGYYKEPNENDPRGNDTIRTVTLNSVKYLPDYAFDNCEQLQTVIIGKDCADIGVAPFRGCLALRSVSNNDYYETDNGIIYSKGENGTYVVEECFASRGNPEIVGQAAVSISNDPKLTSVSAIKPGAFEDCDVITSIDFGNNNTAGLTEIPVDCFKDCYDLQRVVLPRTVNDIENGAFAGSNKLSELTIYGKEVKISGRAFDGDQAKTVTRVRTYDDSAVVRYVKEYGTQYRLQLDDKPLGEQWQVTFLGPDYHIMQQLYDTNGNEIDNPQYVENGDHAVVPKDPVMEGWTFDKWVGMNGTEVKDQIFEDTTFFAQGYSNNGMVGGKYVVNYLENVNGTTFATEYVSPGGTAPELRPPTVEGYVFDHWNGEFENIQGNTNIVAIYVPAGGANISGGTTNTSGGTTNTSGGTTNTSGNTTSNKSTSSSTSSSSSSTSTTSTTSADSRAVSMHRVTVVGGSGSGTYATGATVVISANEPAAGMKFTGWTTESSGVTLNQMTASSTMFVMPENDVLVVANFEGGTAAVPVGTPAVVPTSNNNDQTQDNGNTRVDITKPGISNKDLATANVNGSSDNFIIKISETDEATRAVSAALTNKYGTLDNILYYAMDITLWDATGSYQLTGDQLNGISVDITIPIPDSLVAYGGNNKAGAVINGDQLESLNENFTTINGVPCIRFRATHFSPYTIYVDTGNLVEGMLDTTPKTGDPIHPKWFLSLGLACLSIILFMKKDRRAAVKA